MKHEVNVMGKQCPIPVVMTKKVIDNAAVGDEIEILIDNETAVNNLSRLANKTGCTFVSEKLGDKKYQVKMAVKTEQTGGTLEEEEFVCEAPHKKVTVAVISSNVMGNGDDELGNFNHSSYNTSVALLNEPNSEIVGVIGFRDILGGWRGEALFLW